MTLLIGFLTFILVVNCLFLMLLVLVQLPKKEAGSGLAFGAGATDALFGAGSGNALTKMTKYTATTFLALALVLTVLNSQRHERSSKGLEAELSRKSAAAVPTVTPPPATAPQGQQPLLFNTNQASPGGIPIPPPQTQTSPAPAAGAPAQSAPTQKAPQP
jgi:protein translocase SecG subunit